MSHKEYIDEARQRQLEKGLPISDLPLMNPMYRDSIEACTQGRSGRFFSNASNNLLWVYEEASKRAGVVIKIYPEAYDVYGQLIPDSMAVFVVSGEVEERCRLSQEIQAIFSTLPDGQMIGAILGTVEVEKPVSRRVIWR